MKTRSQRIQDEQAGVTPSPPRALNHDSRPRRTRNPKVATESQAHGSQSSSSTQISALGAAASQLESTTNPSTSVRNRRNNATRGTQSRGRAAHLQQHEEDQQDPVATSEASASTHSEYPDPTLYALTPHVDTFVSQSEPSAEADGNTTRPFATGDDGEPQHSPTGLAAHPVSAFGVPPMGHAHPVQGFNVGVSAPMVATQPVNAYNNNPFSAKPRRVKDLIRGSSVSDQPRPPQGTPPNPKPIYFPSGDDTAYSGQVPVASSTFPGLFPYPDASLSAAGQATSFAFDTPATQESWSGAGQDTFPDFDSPATQAAWNAVEQDTFSAFGTPTTQAQPVQGKRTPSETSRLMAGIISSPMSMMDQQTNFDDLYDDFISGDAPIATPSPSSGLAPIARNPLVTSQTHSNAAASSSADPEHLGTPLPPPLPPNPPHVWNMPVGVDRPHSMVHVFIDAFPANGDTRVPALGQSVAFAIPTEQVTEHLLLAAGNKNSGALTMLDEDPVAHRLLEDYRLTSLKIPDFHYVDNPLLKPQEQSPQQSDQSLQKRKRYTRDTDSDKEKTSPEAVPRPRSTKTPRHGPMRTAFQKVAAEKRRAALEESTAQSRARENGSPRKRARLETMTVPDMYDENGNLRLGKTKQVTVQVLDSGSPIDKSNGSSSFAENVPPRDPIDIAVTGADENPYVEEETMTANGQVTEGNSVTTQQHGHQGHNRVVDTPRARGWGLSSFLPSAQTVSKFIPFSNRIASAAAQPPAAPASANSHRNTDQGPSTPTQSAQSSRTAQTEPRPQVHDGDISMNNAPNATVGPAKRRQPNAKKQLLTKAQAEERKKLKKEKEELRAEKERLQEERTRIALEREELEGQRARAEATQTPGTKRKRVPSPDVIPLPPGGGFGLHPDYFCYSSDEESGDEGDTPTKQPMAKRIRLGSSSNEVVGDPRMATPYTGTIFKLPGSTPIRSNNIFHESATHEKPGSTQTTESHQRTQTNTFSVPDDSDDESEQGSPQQLPITDAQSSSSINQAQTTQATSTSSKSMAPPPPPNPSHASLPPTKSTDAGEYLDPVEKARRKALKHQPSKSSRLRESSQDSPQSIDQADSVIEGKIGDDEDETGEDETPPPASEYDPRRPALLPASTVAPAKPVEAAGKPTNIFGTSGSTPAPQVSNVDPNLDPNLFLPADDVGIEWAYKDYLQTMNPKVQAFIGNNWDIVEDSAAAERDFESDFEEYKQDEKHKQDQMQKPKDVPKPQSSIEMPATSFFNASSTFKVTPKVQKTLDETRMDDDEMEDIDEDGEYEEDYQDEDEELEEDDLDEESNESFRQFHRGLEVKAARKAAQRDAMVV